jgi:hypothetical protein
MIEAKLLIKVEGQTSFECRCGMHEHCSFATMIWDQDGPYFTNFCDCPCHQPNLFERSQVAPMEA